MHHRSAVYATPPSLPPGGSVDCRTVCHSECKDKAALPCVPCVPTPNKKKMHVSGLLSCSSSIGGRPLPMPPLICDGCMLY